ncbi:MAG TPA: D-alanine--D-alanine ligase [Gammaproteobacteria bacterium]
MLPNVVFLHDAHAEQGRPDASDVLAEAAHVTRALEGEGYATTRLPVSLDLAALERALAELPRPLVAFNLVESIGGRGELIHMVPALLEALRVPFTGCSADAQRLTSNKLLAKRALERAGIATPPTWAPGAGDGRWIVKSVWEHASLGLDDASVVRSDAAVAALLEARRREYGGRWFAEAFVPGRELNVGLLVGDDGPVALPVAEIVFEGYPADKPRIVGFAAKWHADSFEYSRTVRRFGVEPPLAAELVRIALHCWRLFELDGYARVDFRVDDAGRPWVLEVNANPCLSADAGFAAMLAEAGIAFPDAMRRLVDDALRRAGEA